jgi:hypothetical protein
MAEAGGPLPKVPKAILDFLDDLNEGYIEGVTSSEKKLAAPAKEMLLRLFPIWKQAEKQAKEEEAAGKRKRDPVAASIGAAINKMAKMSGEEQKARLETISQDLHERMEEKPLPEGAAKLPAAIAQKVAAALGSPARKGAGAAAAAGKTPASPTARQRKLRADQANASFAHAADEFKVPKKHPLRAAAQELYDLAVVP